MDAHDVTQARALVEARGEGQIDFHLDSLDARLGGGMPGDVSAKDYLDARIGGMGWFYRRYARMVLPVLVPLLVVDAFVLRDWPQVGFWGWSSLAGTIAYIAFVVWNARSVVLFDRILVACVRADWNGMYGLTRTAARFAASKFPAGALDYYGARALIGLGRRDEGFALYGAWADKMPREQFLAMNAGLHAAAREFDAHERCMREVTTLLPDSATAWIDIATFLALRGGHGDAARVALAEGEARERTPMANAYVEFVHGMLALDDGDADSALRRLNAAMTATHVFASNPLVTIILAMMQGVRAAALHQLGRRDEARASWKTAGPLLSAHHHKEIIARYGRSARPT